MPVEAPLGTAALPNEPSSNVISASTVGLPRESTISLALIDVILMISLLIKFAVILYYFIATLSI